MVPLPMTFWTIQTLNGVSFGMLLFLLAAGLSLIFGLMRILNLAHGSYYLLGAYVALSVVRATDSLLLAGLAATVAVALFEHPKIRRLIYPGRPDHPHAEIAQRQMRGGSTLVAFEVAGGRPAAFAAANALRLVKLSNNLGDAKSLITHPATTTHQRLTQPQRDALGISDGLLRLSVGLEDPRDLIADLTQALDIATREPPALAAAARGG
jgi:hypothetical protein